jgi:hypothetical protein
LTTWYTTDLPKEVIEILEEDIKKFDPIAQESKLHGDAVDKVFPLHTGSVVSSGIIFRELIGKTSYTT